MMLKQHLAIPKVPMGRHMKSTSPRARAISNEDAKSKRKSATQTGQGQEQEAGKGEGNKYEEQEHEQEGQGHEKVTDRDTCPPPNIPLHEPRLADAG